MKVGEGGCLVIGGPIFVCCYCLNHDKWSN